MVEAHVMRRSVKTRIENCFPGKLKCSKCGREIQAGDLVVHTSYGFKGSNYYHAVCFKE